MRRTGGWHSLPPTPFPPIPKPPSVVPHAGHLFFSLPLLGGPGLSFGMFSRVHNCHSPALASHSSTYWLTGCYHWLPSALPHWSFHIMGLSSEQHIQCNSGLLGTGVCMLDLSEMLSFPNKCKNFINVILRVSLTFEDSLFNSVYLSFIFIAPINSNWHTYIISTKKKHTKKKTEIASLQPL